MRKKDPMTKIIDRIIANDKALADATLALRKAMQKAGSTELSAAWKKPGLVMTVTLENRNA